MSECGFNQAWIGPCKKEVSKKGDHCDEHIFTCASCGEPATKSCAETGMLVCGAPLCDDCDHTTQSNGCNSGGELPEGYKTHCKRDAQVYDPWYVQAEKELK